jgi:hypothetical protein
MSGAYHYTQAEGGIEYALSVDEEHTHEDVMRIIGIAQVHATLALAAATLAATYADAVPSGTHEDWWTVMGGVE